VTGKERIFKDLLRKVWAYFYLLEPLQLQRPQNNFEKRLPFGFGFGFGLVAVGESNEKQQ
jgi:hypothetical protein